VKPSPEGEGLDEGIENTMGFAKKTLYPSYGMLKVGWVECNETHK